MLSSAKVCLLVLGLVWAEVEVQGSYVNEYQQNAEFECPANQILSYMGSVHSSTYQDRIWEFQCREAGSATSSCYWTNYLNGLIQWVQYACPGNEVLNGIKSYHVNYHRDRRFKVQCCTVTNLIPRNCHYTNYINDWHQAMSYHVPAGKVIKGVISKPCSRRRDRRWKLFICDDDIDIPSIAN
ncbi:hypothetical protein BsWGS_25754 [Bradybaena similaris]